MQHKIVCLETIGLNQTNISIAVTKFWLFQLKIMVYF